MNVTTGLREQHVSIRARTLAAVLPAAAGIAVVVRKAAGAAA